MDYLVAKDRSQDERDINLGQIQSPVDYPETYLDDISTLPSYYQGSTPYCGAHAGAWLKTRQEARELGKPISLSPEYLWKKIKTLDGHAPEEGTDMRSIFKALQKYGTCLDSLLPNNIDLPLKDYTDPKTTKEMDDDAQLRIGGVYGFLPSFGWEELKMYTYKNKEILLLLRFDNSYFPSVNPPVPQSTPYGHFVICFGYSDDKLFIKDSANKNTPIRTLSKGWLPFIKEAGAIADLNDKEIANLVAQRDALQKAIDLIKK